MPVFIVSSMFGVSGDVSLATVVSGLEFTMAMASYMNVRNVVESMDAF